MTRHDKTRLWHDKDKTKTDRQADQLFALFDFFGDSTRVSVFVIFESLSMSKDKARQIKKTRQAKIRHDMT